MRKRRRRGEKGGWIDRLSYNDAGEERGEYVELHLLWVGVEVKTEIPIQEKTDRMSSVEQDPIQSKILSNNPVQS